MRLSVIITCYNRSWCISRAIDSAFSFLTTLGGGQIILVDDGSVDDSVNAINTSLLKQESNQAIEVIKIFLLANVGVCKAKNTGASRAREEWITFLDSDDELVLKDVGSFLEIFRVNSDLHLIFFKSVLPGERLCSRISVERVDFNSFVKFGTKGESLPILRREVFAMFPYTETIKGYEGLSYIAICCKYSFVGVCDYTLRKYYTEHSDRLSSFSKILERSASIARGHFFIVRNYCRFLSFSSILVMFLRLVKATSLGIVNTLVALFFKK